MRPIIRWLAAIPLAMVAGFIAHASVIFASSIAHGFDEISMLINSRDMAGMPVTGTYTILLIRALTTFSLVVAAAIVVPSHKKEVALSLAVIITVGFAIVFAYLIYNGITSEAKIGLGVWYRSLIECASYVAGAWAGADHAKSLRELRWNYGDGITVTPY
ncbi:MAG: hypothetical protein Q8M37_00730 [Nevskia sp.]|nr:hypothetical protein [Nevskia sp.]